MADTQSDVLMKFTEIDGSGVRGGGTSEISPRNDTLLAGFAAGCFFEIEDFTLGLELKDFETGGAATTSGSTVPPGVFGSWRDLSKSSQEVGEMKFPVDMDPLSFTKTFDRASPTLFQRCVTQTSFASATIVKRKSTGQERALLGFLRIEFKDVLLVGLSWDDGELVKEKGKFICRSFSVQYKRQASEGELSGSAQAAWERKMALRKA